MRHAIQYQGPYNKNIDRVRNGAHTYLRKDGSEANFRGAKNADGVRFGLPEKHGDEGFVVARIEFGSADILLDRPIELDGIGPNGKLLSKTGALSLLQRATIANPARSTDISRVISSVEVALDE